MPSQNPSQLAEEIAVVRRFNRLYTREIGVLNREFLESPFSLTEVRVLYEISARDNAIATDLIHELAIDPAYMSRILRSLERRGLVVKEHSQTDRRESRIRLSSKGRQAFDRVELKQKAAVGKMLEGLSRENRAALVSSMLRLELLLGGAPESKVPYLLRTHQPGDMGWITHRQGILYNEEQGWNEQFEASVAQIAATFLKNFDAKCERCWIAERDGEIVGSIFCVRRSKTVAQLRLLYVEPSARGLGIGNRLVEECIRFARRVGYRKIMLWTNSTLQAARHIYEREGFSLVREDPHRTYGPRLHGQTWEMTL